MKIRWGERAIAKMDDDDVWGYQMIKGRKKSLVFDGSRLGSAAKSG
jgi:hypothetical protein